MPIIDGLLKRILEIKNSPSEIHARIAEEEYEDYKKRFTPIENELNSLILDPKKRKNWHQGILDNANTSVLSGYNRAKQNIDKKNEMYGNVFTEEEREKSNRTLELERAKTQSNALTGARDYLYREDLRLLTDNAT